MNRGWTAKTQPRCPDRSHFAPVHGLSQTIEGRTWAAIMSRCFNKRCKAWLSYGAKGITACQFIKASPSNFISLVGLRPRQGLSIDRIKNKLHYSCGSCPECKERGWSMNLRWATQKVQCNNKETNRRIEINGRTQTVTQWATESGIPKTIIFNRLRLGWSIANLLAPVEKAKTITINGKTHTFEEWADKIGIHINTLRKRIHRGVPERLLTLPKQNPRAFVDQT